MGDGEKEVENNHIITMFVGETLYIRSKKHLDKYKFLYKESFILKHHFLRHRDIVLGKVED